MKALQEQLTHKIRRENPENILAFLENAFPELHKAMPKAEWLTLASDFFQHYPIKTPIVHEVADLYVDYLHQHSEKKWFELAHYEWVEVALYFDITDLKEIKAYQPTDFTQAIPLISPLAYLLHYEIYNPGFYIAYRNYAHDVFYEPINLFSAKLFELLKSNAGFTSEASLKKLAMETKHPNPTELLTNGLDLIQQWHQKNIILGSVN